MIKLTPSMEDYLKTIHALEISRGFVRVKDIANELEISPPSVSGALNNLKNQGLVHHPRYELVGLTVEGVLIAEQIQRRHRVIREFLSRILRIEPEIAEKDACSMEHSVSPETVEGLIAFLDGDLEDE